MEVYVQIFLGFPTSLKKDGDSKTLGIVRQFDLKVWYDLNLWLQWQKYDDAHSPNNWKIYENETNKKYNWT